MKTLLFCILVLSCSANSFANMRQGEWRWRNDDGTETSATWKAASITSITIPTGPDQVVRLRIMVYRDPSIYSPDILIADNLQYATDISGPWTSIATTPGSNAFVMAGTSAYLSDQGATTSQIAKEGYTFISGQNLVSTATTSYNASQGQYLEFEWAIKSTANTLTGTTYYFQQFGHPFVYDTYPTLTTDAVLPVKWVSFNASRKNNKVNLVWATANEQNNDRFDIMRSADGISWKKIGTQKGKGNSNTLADYQFTDEQPLSGAGYYFINQFDADGQSFKSDTRNVKMPEAGAIIEVYPNPSNAAVSFRVTNKNIPLVEATLANATGAIIYKETFKNVSPQAINKLHLAGKPAAGVYMLSLRFGNTLQTSRVIIQ